MDYFFVFDTSFDEFLEIPSLSGDEGDSIHLDFSKVKIISSTGIRTFLIWLNGSAGKVHVHYHNCPPAVVNQFNFIKGLVPEHAVVDSFQLTYFCESCDKKISQLLENGKDYNFSKREMTHDLAMPSCKDSSCEVEADFNFKKYLYFLTDRT